TGEILEKVRAGDFRPPRAVDPSVQPALEAICLKAMALKPSHRYPSCGKLAADIEHWLADEPVAAWPEPRVVRMQRWMRRHRALVTSAAAALLVALVGSLVGFSLVSIAYDNERLAKQNESVAREKAVTASEAAENRRMEAEKNLKEAEIQRTRADANFGKATAAVDHYMTKVSETKLLENPGMQPLRRDLLTSALGFYEAFLKERRDDPNLKLAVAAAQLRV